MGGFKSNCIDIAILGVSPRTCILAIYYMKHRTEASKESMTISLWLQAPKACELPEEVVLVGAELVAEPAEEGVELAVPEGVCIEEAEVAVPVDAEEVAVPVDDGVVLLGSTP